MIKFIVENIFLRITSKSDAYEIITETDPALPLVPINEFVVWEIIEPLIQNSIDHGGQNHIKIKCKTRYDSKNNRSYIIIEDNGVGIAEKKLNGLLVESERIGLKNVSQRLTSLYGEKYGLSLSSKLNIGTQAVIRIPFESWVSA